MKLKNILSLFFALISLGLDGCANLAGLQHQSIKAIFAIHPNDPNLKQLMALTNELNIDASGDFQEGDYTVRGKKISIAPGTSFKFNLSLPIDDPNVITTENASCKLWTSKPVYIAGIPAPQTLMLDKGKVTGDLDFARIVTVLLMNIMQDQPAKEQNKDLRGMFLALNIKTAELQFRPDSVLNLNGKSLHFGDKSKMELTDIAVDKDANFAGKCFLSVNFMPNCHWAGQKIDCGFYGGSASLVLNAKRNNHVLTFELANPKDQIATLKDCSFIFGQDKNSSATCKQAIIHPQILSWQKAAGATHPSLHLNANMNLNAPVVTIQTNSQKTSANFPGTVGSNIDIVLNDGAVQTQLQTFRAAYADKVCIQAIRPTSSLDLHLANANVGPFVLNKGGNLSLTFAKGTAKLERLHWSNGKKYFDLIASGRNDILMPNGMSMSKSQDSKFRLSLPLQIKLGNAKVKTSAGEFGLDSVAGKMLISIDKDVSLNGDIDILMKSSSFMGAPQLAVKINGFNLVSNRNLASIRLANCAVTVPNADLQKSLQSQLENTRTLNLDKVVMDQQHWRYKNAEIKTVTLQNMTLNKLSIDSVNTAKFSVGSSAIVNGSIDQGSMMSVFKKNTDNYQNKAWKIKADCQGNGVLKFVFAPGNNLSNSKLTYDLNMTLPMPNNIDLDWSSVAHGLSGNIERGVIVAVLKSIKPIPVKLHGDKQLFSNNKRYDAISVSKFTTQQIREGVQLSFTGNATF